MITGMYSREKQQKKYAAYWQSVLDQAELFCLNGDPEALHQLRLSVKKIRALRILYPKKVRKKLAAHFTATTELYRLAGTIRSAGVHLQILKAYAVHDPGFARTQQRIISQERNRLCAEIPGFSENVSAECAYFLIHLVDLKNKQIRKIVDKHMQRLKNIFAQQDPDPGLFHHYRKKIKKLLHVYKILPEKITSEIPLNAEYLVDLETAIGKWHDTILAIELVEARGKIALNSLNRLRHTAKLQLNDILEKGKQFHHFAYLKNEAK